jgi:hypothetical protein
MFYDAFMQRLQQVRASAQGTLPAGADPTDSISRQDQSVVPTQWTPLLSGAGARFAAVLLSAPLEQLRTRMQAIKATDQPSAAQSPARVIWRSMQQEMQAGGVLRLWAGVLPCLWRYACP